MENTVVLLLATSMKVVNASRKLVRVTPYAHSIMVLVRMYVVRTLAEALAAHALVVCKYSNEVEK